MTLFGLLVCDPDTGEELVTLPVPFPVTWLQFSDNGRALLVKGAKGLRVLGVGPRGREDRQAVLRAREGAWHRIELARCVEAGNDEGAAWHMERLTGAERPEWQLLLRRAVLR